MRRFADLRVCRAPSERSNAQSLREAEALRACQRQVLELHDGVIQGLSVAQLALDLDRPDQTREALLEALENTRAIVSRTIEELQGEGVPLAQLLLSPAIFV